MNIIHYLDQSSRRFPQKTALIDEHEQITFLELKRRADKIATGLIHRFDTRNKPYVVLINRDAASICAFLGVAASGNFYVPVDMTQPIERLRTILSQIEPTAVISVHQNVPEELVPACPVLDYEDLVSTAADLNAVGERIWTTVETDPLYAICTSGSTGVPKAVLISHQAVNDFIPVFTKTFGFSEEDIFGNQAPFDFDVSVKDIYSVLYLGATLYVIPKTCFSMPKRLVEVLDDYRITVVIWAVSALCVAATFNVFKHRVPSALRKVLFSGEVMPIKMLNIWRSYLPDAMYVNLYGPTEITCNCMYYIVDREFDLTEKLPLGKTFANREVLVLKEDGTLAGVGEEGELCVRGTSLAIGYYRNPEKTAEVFVQNPLNRDYPDRIYRTGDLVQVLAEGEYVFSARKDFQIKHMGHRIELEEIESLIGATDGVLRTCCIFDDVHNKIVAFYVGEADKTEIIMALRKKLPKYMLPNIFCSVDAMPLTKNGKIDRKQLKADYLQNL